MGSWSEAVRLQWRNRFLGACVVIGLAVMLAGGYWTEVSTGAAGYPAPGYTAPESGSAQGNSDGSATATTDLEGDGASVSDPVETTVEVPAPRDTSVLPTIREQDAITQSSSGYQLFGQQVMVEAATTSTTNRLTIRFDIYPGIVPGGVDINDVQIFRNGTLIPVCTTSPPSTTDPDPCRNVWVPVNGNWEVTIYTSQASDWNFGATSGGGGGGGSGGGSTPAEQCTDGVDNDSDGKVDGADSDCASAGQPPANGPSANAPPASLTGFQRSFLNSTVRAQCLSGECAAGSALATAAASGSVYRVTVSGRFRGSPCAGRVRLTYRVKRTRGTRRTARVRPSCRYRRVMKLRVSGKTKLPATLKISQRFLGSKAITAGRGKTLRVKLKRR